MMYPDVDGYYPYYMYDRESLPQCIITNTTSPKEYGQKLLNRKKGKRKWVNYHNWWQHQEKMQLKSTNIKKSNIMEKNYTDKLEKKIDFLTDILTEEQLDQYIKWCEENGI